MRKLSIGAEAVVYADDSRKTVEKQRLPKNYRIKELDDRLRLHRMRREAKVIESLQKLGIPVPKLISSDEKTATITMQLIEGKKIRDVLDCSNYKGICGEIGKCVGIMHRNNIIHGDLTTSNIIHSSHDGKIFFVDFGLSLFSNKEEDKAVDLHLFRQALNSSHNRVANECFAAAIAAYKEANSSGWKNVLNRLGKVEGRGRNKGKGKD
ncbi:Kae1-associated serine/threonine protein kinase [Candidatus Woesearchaeota archaeon]|nr:Kae1-associated serine/threonine protein kinase [Candidatus Woesearchaeota archaeon]